MRVDIEKRHIDSYNKIIIEANNSIRKGFSVNNNKYKKDLLRKDISVEGKKKKLVKSLHELILNTFSIDIKQIKKKKSLDGFKNNVVLIRDIIHKVKSLNNFLEEGLMKELGIIKKSSLVKAIKSGNPDKYLQNSERILSKSDLNRIEHTIYELMRKILFFDKKLLKDYKGKKVIIIKSEKLGIKDLERIIKMQDELLETLEAKIPPPGSIKAKLFRKDIFNLWVPMIFALLSNFESEFDKERSIFSIIKKNIRLKKKIENKINHIVHEKENVLKMKEKRVLAMKGLGKISDDYRQVFHEYVSAASL